MIRIGRLRVSIERRALLSNGQALRLGSRAFDILALLIGANGKLVSRDEIMRRVWPDTIVEDNNIQVHISALRRILGEDRDRILTVPGRGYRIVLPSYADAPDPEQQHEARTLLTNNTPGRQRPLPVVGSHLIGREAVLAELMTSLRASSSLTLVGTGGAGKTRLAVEVARGMQGEFADGVVFVSFSTAHNAETALNALTLETCTGLPSGRSPYERIADEWRERSALVVLDNCEHVADVAAKAAETLINAGSGMRVLSTSREALRTCCEVVYVLPPLAVPDKGDSGSKTLNSPAVQFFLASLRALDVHLALDDVNVQLLGEICRRLDGIPLALELAAARASLLGIQLLAVNLDDVFDVLTGGRRNALPRHRTFKATLDWSYSLLDGIEQKVLRWLGTFATSFTSDAACRLLRGAGLDATEVLNAISGLVSKSFLTVELDGAIYRYCMLETTRAYAWRLLDDSGELIEAASAHASLVRDGYCC